MRGLHTSGIESFQKYMYLTSKRQPRDKDDHLACPVELVPPSRLPPSHSPQPHGHPLHWIIIQSDCVPGLLPSTSGAQVRIGGMPCAQHGTTGNLERTHGTALMQTAPL